MSSDFSLACQLVDRISFLNPEYTEKVVEDWLTQLFSNPTTSFSLLETEESTSSLSNPNAQLTLSSDSSTIDISPQTQSLSFTLRASLFPHYLLDSDLDSIIHLLGLTETWLDDALGILLQELHDQYCCENNFNFNTFAPYWDIIHMALLNSNDWSISKELRLQVNELNSKICHYQEEKTPFTVIEQLIETNSDQLICRLASNVNFYQHFLLYFVQTYLSKPCPTLLNSYIGLNDQVLKLQTWKKPVLFPFLQAYLTHSIHLLCFKDTFSLPIQPPLLTWAFLILEQKFVKTILMKPYRSEQEWSWLYFLRYPSQLDLLLSLNDSKLISTFCQSSSIEWVTSLTLLVNM